MENNRSSFWDFSDKLRHQENNYCNLSVNDSIWSNSGVSRMPEARRNLDSKLGGEMASSNPFYSNLRSDFNGGFSNDGWKDASNSGFKPVFNGLSNDAWKDVGITGFRNDGLKDFSNSGFNSDSNLFSNDVWKDRTNSGFRSFGSSIGVANVGGMSLNGGFNKGIYSNHPPAMNFGYEKGINNVVGDEIYEHGVGVGGNYGKKNKGDKEICKEENNSESQNAVDKRFKTLPPSESLPRNEIVGGYIFVCNNDTMQENLKRQLFGLPPRYRDSVRAITPGLPVFLYNYSTRQLHGIFEATSFGGTNIDPTAWEDKKKPGESRFPAQVSVKTRKACEPLEEDSFRPILHHYDGPKFRLELNVPEALSLLDIFYENNP